MLAAGRAEAASPAPRSTELSDAAEGGLHHRHDDELRDALHRLMVNSAAGRGSSNSPSAGLVVGGRSGRRGCQHDAVLVAQAERGRIIAARPGSPMWMKGRWESLRLARRQHQRRVQAGAQVEASAAGRGVGGQLLAMRSSSTFPGRWWSCLVGSRGHGARRSRRPARARVSLAARGSSRWPAAIDQRRQLCCRPHPKVASGRGCRRSAARSCARGFSRACATRSTIISARTRCSLGSIILRQPSPPRRGMSGSRSARSSARLPAVLLDLVPERFAGANRPPPRWRRTRRDAQPPAAPPCICCAVRASMRARGAAWQMHRPATSVTSAPASPRRARSRSPSCRWRGW